MFTDTSAQTRVQLVFSALAAVLYIQPQHQHLGQPADSNRSEAMSSSEGRAVAHGDGEKLTGATRRKTEVELGNNRATTCCYQTYNSCASIMATHFF